ncbi:MAG: acyltransferase, partial [Chthoniobacterales bacterium]|nr:acyltransferase [Chthoniobacterales bacterium]
MTDQLDSTVTANREQTLQTRASRYRPEIDGLRALAVIPVVLFHMGLGCPGGYVGVDVFFVISGYLITRLIYGEVHNGTFNFISFWERRIRRVVPAMVVVLLFTFVAGWMLLLPDHFRMFARSAMAQVGLVANVFFQKQSRYFAPASETMPLLHTWSLSVEEQFYIAFPLILFFAAKRSTLTVRSTITLLLCVSLLVSIYSTYTNAAKAFFLLQSRAWELGIGSILAVLPAWKLARKWIMELLSWAGVAFIVAAIVFYDSHTRFPGIAALLPCLGVFLFIWANSYEMTSAGRSLAVKPVVFVGLISYSLYLWHWPLIVFAKYASGSQWNWNEVSVVQKLLFLVVIVGTSTASWRWVETPFRRRTTFLDRKKVFIFAFAACGSILAMAAVVRAMDGFPSRFPPEALRFAAMKKDRPPVTNIKASDAVKGKFAEIGTPAADAQIALLIWGDSHAMAITPALSGLLKEHNLRGVQATHASTAPVCGFNPGRGLREDAIVFGNAVVAFVEKSHVSNVVMAARWDGYPLDDQFKTSVSQTVTRLREAGAQVWIMKQVPRQRDDVPRAAAKEVIAGRDPALLGVPLAEHLAVRKEADQLFEVARLAGANI